MTPHRCFFNVPYTGFAVVHRLEGANMIYNYGNAFDAKGYDLKSEGFEIISHALSPSHRITVDFEYTGLVSLRYPKGFEFPFVATFHGEAFFDPLSV